MAPTFSPLYQQIKVLITQSLESGEWKPGELIPSEVELGQRYKVSQGTVRKAIDELAAENIVVRRQGRGTFVATHYESQSQFRFLRLKPDEKAKQRATNHFVSFKHIKADTNIAKSLGLNEGESVVYISRVKSFNDTPVILEDIWLPNAIFEGLTEEMLVEYKGPLYGLFEKEFETRMIRAQETIKAIAADDNLSELLKIKKGTPLLQVDRISFTYGDRPVEFRRGWYLTEHYHYWNELN